MSHAKLPCPARFGRATLAKAALALAASLALAGCGGMPTNRLLDSVHQPVVSHTAYTLDLAASANGLASGEQHRLGDWFAAMNLRYGDKVALEDPDASPATRAAVDEALAHYGMRLNRDAPVTAGYVNAGSVRVVITRASANVPHCPDWSANSETNFNNATSTNYGCANNSNLAAMIANPDDLLHGAGSTGASAVVSNDKAINAYYSNVPTGSGGKVKAVSSQAGN